MVSVSGLQKHLRSIGDPDTASQSQRFFKTGAGEYGAGDYFLGIRVPVLRQAVREYESLPLDGVIRLLHSKYHEERLFALFLWVRQFDRGDETIRKQIYSSYLSNTAQINNWDLVDSSAYQIVGRYLQYRHRRPLIKLAKSTLLWERRIAIIATYRFIREEDFADTLSLCEILINDREDLIHKATGWMLREVGNRDRDVEEKFLQQHYSSMPRTMLRYAIEKFSPERRKEYLTGAVSG